MSLNRNYQTNDFNNSNSTNKNSITLNTQAVNDNQVFTKSYVDKFRNHNERNRRDLGLGFYNESNDLVKNCQNKNFNNDKLTSLDSITVNRDPSSDEKNMLMLN